MVLLRITSNEFSERAPGLLVSRFPSEKRSHMASLVTFMRPEDVRVRETGYSGSAYIITAASLSNSWIGFSNLHQYWEHGN
jgi:hypothetical protein